MSRVLALEMIKVMIKFWDFTLMKSRLALILGFRR